MDTTVTGIFPDRRRAALAIAHLREAGFAHEDLHMVDATAVDRHEFIQTQTADTKRGVILGIVIGTLLGLLTGLMLGIGRVFAPTPAAIIGALVGAIGGTILGTLVGRATSTQMEDELEHQVEAGNVLVSVTTHGDHGQRALDVLARDGAVNMVSSAATFRAGVLPVTEPGRPQEEIPQRSRQDAS